jgi:hypothetical protein
MHVCGYESRVARRYIFKPKIQLWVNFGGSYNRRCWYILCPFGRFCGHLVHYLVIWHIFPVLVCCDKKNLATLYESKRGRERVLFPLHHCAWLLKSFVPFVSVWVVVAKPHFGSTSLLLGNDCPKFTLFFYFRMISLNTLHTYPK